MYPTHDARSRFASFLEVVVLKFLLPLSSVRTANRLHTLHTTVILLLQHYFLLDNRLENPQFAQRLELEL